MTTALFLLRAVQMGLSMEELDSLEIGAVYDLMVELGNDDCNYKTLASQDDFDRF